MTVKTEGVATGSPAARTSGNGSTRARTMEQLSRADRAARGKEPGRWPRWSRMPSSRRPGRDPVGLLLGQAESRVPELVPVRHGRMLVSPFTFYRGAALPMAADLAGTPARGCGCSCAGTRTCPISARSPRRSGGWSSTSTTSTRPCPGRSSGTSSGWPRAWPWPPGTTATRQGRAQDRPGGGRRLPHRDARVRGADLPGRLVRAPGHRAGLAEFRSQVKAKRFKPPRSCWPRPTPPTA
jgi:Uncharacterized protein conserved in bacteria (DUF2252).